MFSNPISFVLTYIISSIVVLFLTGVIIKRSERCVDAFYLPLREKYKKSYFKPFSVQIILNFVLFGTGSINNSLKLFLSILTKKMSFVNEKACLGTLSAHVDDGKVPNIVISMDQMNAFNYGYLVYFFEKACAMSAYLLGINPFNQPGVEIYKKNMFKLLGKY